MLALLLFNDVKRCDFRSSGPAALLFFFFVTILLPPQLCISFLCPWDIFQVFCIHTLCQGVLFGVSAHADCQTAFRFCSLLGSTLVTFFCPFPDLFHIFASLPYFIFPLSISFRPYIVLQNSSICAPVASSLIVLPSRWCRM